MTSKSTGNCKVGDFMTHPAFISMNTNGLWVGKFETGYNQGDDLSTWTQSNSYKDEVNINKILIKPNIYSWSYMKLGNAFKNSYEYNRSLDSHMMKNTEWGAVAYLSHSKYGIDGEVRINNAINITGYVATANPTIGYVTPTSPTDGNQFEQPNLGQNGSYTLNYYHLSSGLASTTGNKTGVYDMNGGLSEYVMGYNSNAEAENEKSEITSLYSNFFTSADWKKYYDVYALNNLRSFDSRILGDATGEMGPFESTTDPDGTNRYKASWYTDISMMNPPSTPWFSRGNMYYYGTGAGIFSIMPNTGASKNYSYRIVLAPR